jgi:hypothetical protein
LLRSTSICPRCGLAELDRTARVQLFLRVTGRASTHQCTGSQVQCLCRCW